LEERLSMSIKNRIMKDRHRMAIYIEKLKGLSPLDKLNQGYSYVSDEKGRTITDINKVSIGDQLQIYVKNGRMNTVVKEKYQMDNMSVMEGE
ncbi:MAG: exodeoxyribonuclease VII large subunit, partial [Lachnospiraceae bacterium]|nr:exodeoxyribonuclease VII large subunit [Lachnospiraceae bacterium]